MRGNQVDNRQTCISSRKGEQLGSKQPEAPKERALKAGSLSFPGASPIFTNVL